MKASIAEVAVHQFRPTLTPDNGFCFHDRDVNAKDPEPASNRKTCQPSPDDDHPGLGLR